MSSNVLDPSALISLLPSLLPPDAKRLESAQDALAALIHSAFTALGFRLIAVNDLTAGINPGNVFPEQWNRKGPGDYAFNYRHDQSSLEFLIKVSKLGTRTLVNAIALETDKVASLDICTDDFTSPSFYPHSLVATADPLIHGFISSNRVADFGSQLKLKITQKIIPGLRKEGYTEETEPSTTSAQPSTSQNPPPARPRTDPPPDAPDYNPYASHNVFPPRNPLEIGRSDLDPFPRHPFAPPSVFPGAGGDGMFVGPNHPMFGIRDERRTQGRGPWGGDGYLPPLGAPPGARFDPVGPFPPRGPARGPFPPGRGNVGGPDNDEFMPPGMGDMFM